MLASLVAYVPSAVVIVGGLWWNAMSDGLPATVVVAVGCILLVATGEWRNNKLRKQLLPNLRFVIGQGAPFEREKPTVVLIKNTTPKVSVPAGGMKIHSVGLVNAGHESAIGVRVRLLRIDPPELRQYWAAPLHVANEPVPVDRCDVHLSNSPIVFFEVLSQHLDMKTKRAKSLHVRFAGSLFERELPLRDRYFLTLAIDGPKSGVEERFVLQINEHGQYEMRKAIY